MKNIKTIISLNKKTIKSFAILGGVPTKPTTKTNTSIYGPRSRVICDLAISG